MFPPINLDLNAVKQIFESIGCKNLFVKELAWNHDSKRQIYLTSDLSAFNIFPSTMEFDPEMPEHIQKSKKPLAKDNDRIFGHLDFYWITPELSLDHAQGAKLIYYPQYPEVRLSGFMRGTNSIPSEYMRAKAGEVFDNRLLFLGTDSDKKTFGFLVVGNESLRAELRQQSEYKLEVGLNRLEVIQGMTAEQRVIAKLKEIHLAGWHLGKRLKNGVIVPCHSPQAVGYTMEALLNVAPNSDNAPDFEGFEIKAFTVSNFNRITNKSVTVFAPEPDLGVYVAGIIEFLKTYGYPDRKGRADRQNFGGVHRVGQRHSLTKLLLELAGYDSKNPSRFDVEGKLQLIDELDQLAAGWSFKKLISRWKNKHEKAVYVPAIKDKSVVRFQYSNQIEFCYGADFLRVLDCLATGDMCYDPAVKATNWVAKPKIKKRNQFRIKASKISSLYLSSKRVDINDIE